MSACQRRPTSRLSGAPPLVTHFRWLKSRLAKAGWFISPTNRLFSPLSRLKG